MTEQVLTRAGGRVEVVASLSQGRTAAAQCGLFTHKSVPVIFEPPCNIAMNIIVLFLRLLNKSFLAAGFQIICYLLQHKDFS